MPLAPIQPSIPGTLQGNEPARKTGSSTATLKTDETRLSSAAATLSAANAEPTLDTQRIEALREQIANGTYQPNARSIAEKILQEAWLGKH